MRGGGGYLARDSISRLNLGISGSIRSRSHELHNPESRVRTSGHSLSHPPRIHGPESGGAPAKSTGVRCAETRIQSPESTTEAEGRVADPQIPESGLRRHAQGSRGREGAQDTGSGLSGEGWRGAGPKGAGREGGDSGVNFSANEKPKKTGPLSPAGKQDCPSLSNRGDRRLGSSAW